MIFDVNAFDPASWNSVPAPRGLFTPEPQAEPANSAQMPAAAVALPSATAQPCALTGAAAGTLVLTARGPVAIEALAVGDLVLTADHGYQPLRWIGQRQCQAPDLDAAPELGTIRIRSGALGPAQPAADLLVAPQQQILVREAWLERMFDLREAFISARHLLVLEGVELANDLAPITYFQLLFDSHEVIFLNGAKTGSLENGQEALAQLDPQRLHELLASCPALGRITSGAPCGARPLLDDGQSLKFSQGAAGLAAASGAARLAEAFA